MKKIKKIRRIWEICWEYWFFLFLLLMADLFFGFLLWLMDKEEFWILTGIFAVMIFLLFGIAVVFILRREEERQEIVIDFLENHLMEKEFSELSKLSVREREQLLLIGNRIREDREELQNEQMLREEYEEYIETWVHEIKVPLSLATLLLDNRREEMSPFLYQRLVYVTSQISEYVTQILYYARLKGNHKDYRFERISLEESCKEMLEQYEALLKEEEIQTSLCIEDVCILTDRKGFLFILEQALSNVCKYKDNEKEHNKLKIFGGLDKNKIYLSIEDNGIGTKREDLPFLFDRGFTGNTNEKKRKATGMGLYLAKQMAQNLNIDLTVESEYGQGFKLLLEFSVVEDKI